MSGAVAAATRPGAVTRWLADAPSAVVALWGGGAAFATYFAMYAYRKPFAAARFEHVAGWPFAIDYKVVLVIAQVAGYACSKLIGIRVVSAMPPGRRAATILGLIGFAEAALVAFALAPPVAGVAALFANGLALGLIWGLVFAFLEGRRVSEVAGAMLCATFIVASGAVKAVGAALIDRGWASEAWMPAATGLLFAPLLLVAVAALAQLPPPDAADVAARAPRAPMTAAERRRLFRAHAGSLILLIAVYVVLTAVRDFRDNFAAEIWHELGFAGEAAIFAWSELPVAVVVLAALALLARVRGNRAGVAWNFVLVGVGLGVMGAATGAFAAALLGSVAWMIALGAGAVPRLYSVQCAAVRPAARGERRARQRRLPHLRRRRGGVRRQRRASRRAQLRPRHAPLHRLPRRRRLCRVRIGAGGDTDRGRTPDAQAAARKEYRMIGRLLRRWATAVLAANALTAPVAAAPLLLISIDGLRPADVLDAKARGIAVPNLRRFVDYGAYATGVVGVLPTLTYPSHTTLLTGVAPGKHGIVNNLTFDPTNINQTGWYWYASDIRVPTLWDAAHAAGRTVANVHWPVSVGATGIDWNLPQYWRTGHDDDRKLLRVLATPGLVADLETKLGPYTQGIDESVAGDVERTRFAVRLLTDKHPGFATVYLTGLDHVQHESGPGTSAAHAALERIDGLIGELVAAVPGADVAIVSDHGFASVDTDVNLFGAFIKAGLITVDKGKVTGWQAVPWFAGGSAAVVMARRDDPALRAKIAALLTGLKANLATHITAVLDHDGLVRRGAGDAADWFVEFVPGTEMGRDPAAPLVAPSTLKGMHGYDPGEPAMRSTFLVMGPDTRLHGDLGTIDMRRIAPTLAQMMGASLPTADLPALPEPR